MANARTAAYEEILNPQIIPQNKKYSSTISSPPGFGPITATSGGTSSTAAAAPAIKNDADLDLLKSKKIWELAIAPAKSMPMTLFMSYMAGNSLQIIPMTMTFMLLWNPIRAIFNDTNAMFKNLQAKKNSNEILLAKVVFILFQLLNMAVGVYKLYNMGLIPHSEADWLAWKQLSPVKHRLYS
ncbi:uncharacterized protein LODBEIA_P59540 [Lodderomyces beijingensis]|uniref:ER membrane protein complex subunit 4 n=1 Tax=Lodderomyces beijingensis TaxID=1775926 RepID=A0ABP0ZXC8_9ASCO